MISITVKTYYRTGFGNQYIVPTEFMVVADSLSTASKRAEDYARQQGLKITGITTFVDTLLIVEPEKP